MSGLLVLSSCVVPESALKDKMNYELDDDQYKRKFDFTLAANEKPIRYGFHYVVSTIPEGYKVRVFHPDKKVLTEEKTYTTPALTLMHGPYKSFWDDGTIRSQGIYQFGRKHGFWLECEPGKRKSSAGPYLNDKKDGSWTQLDTSGLVESVYTWQDGLRHGKFFEFDTTGHKSNEGIYRADTLVSELFKRSRTEKPYLIICRNVSAQEVYTCSQSTLVQRIYSQLRYPPEARQMKIEGSVLVQWDLMPDGRVQHIRVPQALSDEIEAECLRVLKEMPLWEPARRDGIPVKWTMSIPINFSL